MIIDVNAHTGSWPGRFTDFRAEGLFDQMQQCGIEKAVVSDIDTAFVGSEQYKLAGVEDDRFIRFQSISPEFDINLLRGESIKGIRIYPTYQSWDFRNASWSALMDAAVRSGWIVQAYLKLLDPRALEQTVDTVSVIRLLSETVIRHQEIRFIISGANLAEVQGNPDLFQLDNVWIDTSHVQHPVNSIRKLLDSKDSSKVLFGSNIPFFYPYAGLFRMQHTSIETEEREAILGCNALSLFRI